MDPLQKGSRVFPGYFSNPADEVRLATATALGFMKGPESEGLLLQQLSDEDVPSVRYNLVKALVRQEAPSGETIFSIANDVLNEPDKEVRSQMIRFLGEHGKSNQKVLSSFQLLMDIETSNDNLKLIGKYMP